MHNATPTKKAFRLINESRSYCIYLATIVHDATREQRVSPRKQFDAAIDAIITELKGNDSSLRHIAMGSLYANQFRFGKWRKIPQAECNVDSYFNRRQAEQSNPGMINPDEVAAQEKKREQYNQFTHRHSKTAMTEKRHTTRDIERIINKSTTFSRRLRKAADENMHNKHNFYKEAQTIIDELGAKSCYRNSLSFRLWKNGAWRQEPYMPMLMRACPAPKDHPRFIGMDFACIKEGELSLGDFKVTNKVHDETCIKFELGKEQYAFANQALSDATRRIAAKIATAREEHLSKLIVNMDFADLEKRVTCPAAMSAAYGGGKRSLGAQCYATREHSLYPYQDRMMHQLMHSYMFNKPKQEEATMNVNIKTQTLINGTPLTQMDNSDLVSMISRLEDNIASLTKLDTKSAHITNEIEAKRKQCAQLAGFLDARDS